MLKKFNVLLLMCLFIFASVLPVTAASEQKSLTEPDVIFQAPEITDFTAIKDHMDNGITDDNSFKIEVKADGDIYTDDLGNKYRLKATSIKSTSQKLKETRFGTSNVIDYVANVLVTYNIVPMSNGSTSENADPDSHEYASLYQTVNYSFYTDIPCPSMPSVKGTNIKITKNSATLVREESTVALVQLLIKTQANGICFDTGSGSGYHNYNKTDTRTISSPTSSTEYSLTPTNTIYWWWTKYNYIYSSAIGCTASATVRRGTTTWYLNTELLFPH